MQHAPCRVKSYWKVRSPCLPVEVIDTQKAAPVPPWKLLSTELALSPPVEVFEYETRPYPPVEVIEYRKQPHAPVEVIEYRKQPHVSVEVIEYRTPPHVPVEVIEYRTPPHASMPDAITAQTDMVSKMIFSDSKSLNQKLIKISKTNVLTITILSFSILCTQKSKIIS
ncbi:hypothetical protein AVEN_177484-1 [Araneus ventricosus]|uniref:Uncharacterized protein n=1 Tax=Araneus ventricosus TaxID=182803 RepID=A0A4Y2D3S1_ARAVE|nr:hypothetical protein AVEN_177484-1 [Araneus ventricosus]